MTAARIILAAAVVLLAACGGESRESAPPRASAPVGAETERVGQAGVSVALPAQWHATTPNDGPVVDPLARVVVASSPIQPKESACQVSAYEFAADAVALVILEWTEPQALLPQRPDRFTSEELPVRPPPAIECFDGPGGSVQFVDRGRSFGAYLLAGPTASETLIEQARQVLGTLVVEEAGASLDTYLGRNGVSVGIPPGWDGRILYRDPAGSRGVIFQVANFKLPTNQGLEPPTEPPPGKDDPITTMNDGDVLITVTTDEPDGLPTRTPIAIAGLRPVAGPRVPRGHRQAGGSFCLSGKCVRIEVDFGDQSRNAALNRQVDDVLASISVE